MASWGLTVDKNGVMQSSICRAKHPGSGRCNHFAHVKNAASAQKYIVLHQLQPDLMKVVNYDKDVNSLHESVKDYMSDRGVDVEYTPTEDGVNIIDTWFNGDRKLAERILGEAQEEGVIPKIKASDTVRTDIHDLTVAGVKVEVDGDRFAGMNPEADVSLDTDVWMTANGLSHKMIDGEAPVTLMVAEGAEEAHASDKIRSNWSKDQSLDSLISEERRSDFEHAGYASLHGQTTDQISE
jgi:hypothetical protein